MYIMNWSNISKIVGWDEKKVDFPTAARVDQLENQLLDMDFNALIELLTYHRFCSSPVNDEQRQVLHRVTNLVVNSKKLMEDFT